MEGLLEQLAELLILHMWGQLFENHCSTHGQHGLYNLSSQGGPKG